MYRWKLQIYNSTFDISPVYANAIVSEEREEGFMFTRKKFPQITLSGRDFDLVKDGSIRYEYIIILQELIDGDYTEILRGKFTKLECKIDNEQRKLDVTPITVDRYTTFLEGLDKEYDFLKYNPGVFSVNYNQTSVIQIYVAGSTKLTNIIGGRRWEQECTLTTDHDTLVNDYKFSPNDVLKVFIAGVGDGVSPDVTGEYEDINDAGFLAQTFSRISDSKYKLVSYGMTGARDNELGLSQTGNDQDDYLGTLGFNVTSSDFTDDDFNSVWQDDNGKQMSYIGLDEETGLECFREHDLITGVPPTNGSLTHVSGATNTATKTYTGNGLGHGETFFRWTIYDTTALAGSEYVFLAPVREPLNEIPTYSKGATFTSVSSSDQVRLLVHLVYTRVLTDSVLALANLGISLLSASDYLQPDPDIISKNENYRYVVPIDIGETEFTVSDENGTTLDDFGIMASDALHFSENYFSRPAADVDDSLIPVNIDEWTEQSLWFDHDAATNTLQAIPRTIVLRHAYKLSDVISTLLGQIDSNLTHQETTAYSDFFYGSGNSIRGTQRTTFITPKSNVTETNYNRPATRSKIKFKEIIDMLANVYNCYVDIDEDNKLIIEQAAFFRNGRSYSSTNSGINLSEIVTTRRVGLLTDGTEIYSYDADNTPEIQKWEWMDEVSEPFEGLDMISLDSYAKEGLIDTKQISQFTSDIDYIIVNSEAISKDGFAILEATLSNGVYTVTEPTVDGLALQNGHLSVSYIQENYFIHNAPTSNQRINGNDTDVVVAGGSVRRQKLQEIKLPKIPNFDTRRLITTSLGSGLVRAKTEDLDTGETNITIEHDTEL